MDEVLVGCSDFARVYIDDILVVSECWEVHLCHLRSLFETLREAGLTCKLGKCAFGKKRLEFLGHLIGDGVVCVPEARVRAIRDHPLPRTRRKLRAFLGLIGYYRRFVSEFHRWSLVLTPHTSMTLSGEMEWTSWKLDAFRMLCMSCESVCLNAPCVSDLFVVECDARCTSAGAMLSVRTRAN